MSDGTEVDKIPALLTEKQREYLTAEGFDGTAAAQRAIRARIRTRLRWGMYDFNILLGNLSPDQRAEVFNERGNSDSEEALRGTLPIRTTLIDALGFFYLVATDLDDWWTRQERWEEIDRYDAGAEQFAELVESGIRRAFTADGESIESIDVTINIERGESLSDLAEGPLNELSNDVLNQLLDADEITATEYGEAMQEKIRDRRAD